MVIKQEGIESPAITEIWRVYFVYFKVKITSSRKLGLHPETGSTRLCSETCTI